MPIAAALFFLFLPFLFHLAVTGSLVAGLWIYFFGIVMAAFFIFQEAN